MVGTNPNCPHMFHRACESVAQSLDGQRSHIRSFPPLSPQPTQQGSQPKQPAIDCLEEFQPSRRRPSWRSCSGWRSLKQNSPCSVKRYIWLWSFQKSCDNYLPISMSWVSTWRSLLSSGLIHESCKQSTLIWSLNRHESFGGQFNDSRYQKIVANVSN